MEIHLKSKAVWSAIESEDLEVPAAEAEDNVVAAYNLWKENSLKALDIIVSACEDGQLVYIHRVETAKDAWNALRNQHHHTSAGTLVRINKKLCTHRLQNGGSMQAHIDGMFSMFDQLNEMNAGVSDIVGVGMLLSGLNEEYDGLVTAIEAWDKERLTLVNVKAKLMDEWMKRVDNEGHGAAKYGTGKQLSEGSRSGWRSKTTNGA